MKFTRDTNIDANLVRSYAPGEIRVNDQIITHSVILTSEQIIEWSARSIETMTPRDLEIVLALEPELVILGSGRTHRFPEQRVMATVLQRGIGLEIMNTGAACRTYNVLVHEDRRVAAALLVD